MKKYNIKYRSNFYGVWYPYIDPIEADNYDEALAKFRKIHGQGPQIEEVSIIIETSVKKPLEGMDFQRGLNQDYHERC